MQNTEHDFLKLEKIFEPELLAELLKLEVHKFAKGFSFQGGTDEPGAIPIVIKGFINVTKTDEKGRVFPVYTINQGESCIIAINAIIQSSANKGQDGITGTETETIVVSAKQSKEWIDKYSSWRNYIFDLYGKRLDELLIQHEIVTEQKDQIQDRNDRINNSIKYARRIQNAVMPSDKYMKDILPEYFIFNKPRDIVSGDFYWTELKDNQLIVVAADSTGHGVPGAFMSMLGVSMLNEIVNKEGRQGASEILNQLRVKIKLSLNQTGERNEQKDGFDMALCVIDLENRKMDFAGAYNPLYLMRNNELVEIKADKMPVGIHIKEKESFTTHKAELEPNDIIYIFSDGYTDQFGGEYNQKFSKKSFKKLLIKIHQEPLKNQEQILSDKFDEWKGDLDQLDDVLVFGIKIK